MITEPKELYGFLTTLGVEVMNLAFSSDDLVWISSKYGVQVNVPSLRHTNEVIRVYVTPGARIHLCRYLDRLKENAISCVTDSVL